MQMRTILFTGTLIFLLLSGAACNSTAQAPSPPRVAFQSGQAGDVQILSTMIDGSGLTQLTDLPGNKGPFAFSPDGQWLAFSADKEGSGNFGDVYLMGLKNSRLTQLYLSSEANKLNMAWSPDSQSLAFASDLLQEGRIWVISLTGAEIATITLPGLALSPFHTLAWSPDGQQLALVAYQPICCGEPNTHIYVIDADGTNLRQLTDGPQADDEPVWAPTGDRLYFRSFRDGQAEIYTMRSDGTEPINLTQHPAGDSFPLPSPDGRKIAFTSNRDGGIADLFIMNADGTGPISASLSYGKVTMASWSPDGEWLAFANRESDGRQAVYLVDKAGGSLRRLTPNMEGAYPVWVPKTP